MFSEDDLRLLETLANQAAVALENGHLEQSLAELSRLKEQLRYQAYHDPLTGLPNRTPVPRAGRCDRHRLDPSDKMPVVLFLDLDDFKVVNDTLGHAAGDRLLVRVAAGCGRVLRADDVAARLGGDEFAVLLDDDPGLGRVRGGRRPHHRSVRAVVLRRRATRSRSAASIGIAAARLGTEQRGRAPAQRRRRDVHGQGLGQEPGVGVRADDARRDRRAPRAAARSCRGASAGASSPCYYQPIVSLAGRTGHRRRGARALAPPDPRPRSARASSSTWPRRRGMILPLGRWVLSEACRQAADVVAVDPGRSAR